jgi:hypothetical protein
MKWILPAVFLAAIPAFAFGADFAGTWKVTYAGAASPAPQTIGSMIFDFKINGGEVVGLAHIGVWPGLAPIAEGKVDGDHISFVATGYMPSTTGTPTCRIEGTLSGDDLVIKLTQIRNPGGPGSGGAYEYRGGRLDAAAAKAEKLRALATLSVHREYSRSLYPDVEPQPPTDFDAALIARAPQLAANITAWELVKPRESGAESFSDQDLDDLIAFYNSPAGQAMIKAQPPAVETALAAFLARR